MCRVLDITQDLFKSTYLKETYVSLDFYDSLPYRKLKSLLQKNDGWSLVFLGHYKPEKL